MHRRRHMHDKKYLWFHNFSFSSIAIPNSLQNMSNKTFNLKEYLCTYYRKFTINVFMNTIITNNKLNIFINSKQL